MTKSLTIVLFILVVLLTWLYLIKPSGAEWQLNAIRHQRDSIQQLASKSLHRQKVDSIIYRVKDDSLKLMRRLNIASYSRLKTKEQQLKKNEKKLSEIMLFTNAVMDSLYRAKYPKADSTIR